MAKKMFAAGAAALMLVLGAVAAGASESHIDAAVRRIEAELSPRLESGARIAVVSIGADSERASNRIIDRLIEDFDRRGRFAVVTRDAGELAAIYREVWEFQRREGLVSWETMASVGNFYEARFLVVGELEHIAGNAYRLRVSLLDTERAEIVGVASADVSGCPFLGSLVIPLGLRSGNFDGLRTSRVSIGVAAQWDIMGRLGRAHHFAQDYRVRTLTDSSLGSRGGGLGGFVSVAPASFLLLELSLGYRKSWLSFSGGMDHEPLGASFEDGDRGSLHSLDVGLRGKLPIVVSERLAFLFPIVGVGYSAALSGTLGGISLPNPGILSSLNFKAGAGLDAGLRGAMFLRASLMYVNRRAPRFFADWENSIERAYIDRISTHMGHGATLSLGIGRRF